MTRIIIQYISQLVSHCEEDVGEPKVNLFKR
jgi:hypothetical protein